MALSGNSPGTPGRKPVAPPRRVRSKKGSESEASLDQPGTLDFGANFADAFSPAPQASQAKAVAPPRRSRSKIGSVSEGEAITEAPASLESGGSGAFDFGASFTSSFSPAQQSSPAAKAVVTPPPRRSQSHSKKGSESEGESPRPASTSVESASGVFDFGADFPNACPPPVAEEVPAQPGGVSASGTASAFEQGDTSFVDTFSTPAAEVGGAGLMAEEATNPSGSSAGLFDFGAGFTDASGQLPKQGGGNDPFQSGTSTSTHSLDVDFGDAFPPQDATLGADFSNAFPPQDATLGADFGGAFPPQDATLGADFRDAFPSQDATLGADFSKASASLPQSTAADVPDPFSADADRAFSALNIASVAGSDSFSAPEPLPSASSSSLFDLDFGGLMSAAKPAPTTSVAAPSLTNTALEGVQSMDRRSPASCDSPVAATFYLGESSMSASSSAAELTALEKVDPAAAGKPDPFAGLFSDKTASAVQASLSGDPSGGNPPSSLLRGVDGSLEPAELPPPPPPSSASHGDGEEGGGGTPNAPLGATSVTASSECEQGEADAESQEVHFCQS